MEGWGAAFVITPILFICWGVGYMMGQEDQRVKLKDVQMDKEEQQELWGKVQNGQMD